MKLELDNFTKAYIECALWSSNGDNGEPLDSSFSIWDLADETLGKIVLDCIKFQRDNEALLKEAYQNEVNYDSTRAGHDFWLTRNGHGAGFWDRAFRNERLGDALTEASKQFKECDLYVGDDNLIYL